MANQTRRRRNEMLKAAGLCSAQAHPARIESNLAAHRKLDPELKHVDLRLQLWGAWARPGLGFGLGYPGRAVTERAGEGGILAKDLSTPVAPEWPDDVVQTERSVASLPTRHQAALMANYFYGHLPMENRGAIYVGLSKHLAKTRPSRYQRFQVTTAGPRAFRDDLDRARWTLKQLLHI